MTWSDCRPPTTGTTHPLAAPLGLGCPACAQQAAGSPFITQLNAGDETPGSADYTNVVTRYDEVVTPYTSGFLASDGNAVTNVVLQGSARATPPSTCARPTTRQRSRSP